jgi:pectin methylesterase-like acyl-CoA thioesterase
MFTAALLAVPVLFADAPDASAASAVTLTVGASGAEYTTVQAAVNAVPNNSTTPYVISIEPGRYEGTVTIPASKTDLSMIGADHNAADVVIDAANYNQKSNGSGGTLGTVGSATATIAAPGFTAEYVTFSNSFDKLDFPSVTGTQAVALAMEGDKQIYEHDVFYGHQDTLLSWDSTATKALRQYIYDSTVEGDVDFIFGDGTMVVDRSNIVALNDGIYAKSYLTAPATYTGNPSGELITGSTVSTTLAPNTIYLGRAWAPFSGTASQLVVRNTSLPAQVFTSDPYLGISGATWTPGRNFEYDNTGGGATVNADRPQLTSAQAPSYTAQTYLAGSDGWDPVAPATARPTTASIAQFRDSQLGDTRDITAPPRIPAVCQAVPAQLANPADRVFDAADEQNPPDTARIQAALSECTNTGEAVLLTTSGPDTAFLSDPLTIGEGEYLVLGEHATLYATLNAAAYQTTSSTSTEATCGTISTTSNGCNAFITVTGADSGIEAYRGRGGDGTIDGRGDLPILGTDTTWWANAVTAKDEGLKQVNPRLVQITSADDFTVYDITLKNAPKEHIYYKTGGGLLVWGLTIDTNDASLNTDGIDFDSSAYGTVADSVITDGDDCVAMQTNDATDAHVTVRDDSCYGTHGISIGSETTFGLEDILVEHDSINGLDAAGQESSIPAGIRVKSYAGAGGVVTAVTYRDITMSHLLNPIDIDPFYDPPTGTSFPDFAGITIQDATEAHSLPGAESVLDGYDAQLPLGLTLDGVRFDVSATTSQYANVTEHGSDLAVSGPGVTVQR